MIGVFDSGFGGLTVLKEYIKLMPEYSFVYLGDNARAPYGQKNEEIIYDYSVQATEFLFEKGCELVVFACNTASSGALRKIQQQHLPKHHPNKKVLGVLVPVAEEVVEKIKKNKTQNIGIIGTALTVESGSYENEINKKLKKVKYYKKACPLLVPLVEEGMIKNKATKIILRQYLKKFKNKKIDILILACTHYPLLKKQIKSILKNCYILDTPKAAAQKLKKYLENHPKIDKKIKKNKKITYYTTGEIRKFKKLGQRFLGKKITDVNKIKIS